MNYIKFKEQDSRYIKGLIICELPPIVKPQMRVAETVIDGVDGSIIEELGYASYDKALAIGITQKANIDEVIKFFSGTGEVVFSNEPDKYYKATIINQIDYARLVRFRTATVTFRVQPFKYKLDELPVSTGIIQEFENHLISNGVYADGTAVETSEDGDGWETITRFVEVKESRQYILQGTLTQETWQITVYFYDADKTLVEQRDINHENNVCTFSTPANTKYLKFCGYSQVIDLSTVNLIEPDDETMYSVDNKGNETSKPLIHISGQGAVECRVNGNSVFRYTFPENETDVFIDSELQDAYLGTVLKNRNMSGEFPVLQSGYNEVSFSGTVNNVEITARSRWL